MFTYPPKIEPKEFFLNDLFNHSFPGYCWQMEELPSIGAWALSGVKYFVMLSSSSIITLLFACFCWLTCIYIGVLIFRRLKGNEPTNRFPVYVPILYRDIHTKIATALLTWYLFMLKRAIGEKYKIPGHLVNGFTIFKVAKDYYIEISNKALSLFKQRFICEAATRLTLLKLWFKPYIDYRRHRRLLFYRYRRRVFGEPQNKMKGRIRQVLHGWGSKLRTTGVTFIKWCLRK